MNQSLAGKLSIDVLAHSMGKLGYRVFVNGEYNLNIFGVRSKNNQADKFDDIIGCFYAQRVDGKRIWQFDMWSATTDPGLYWLENPSRIDGTAILKPGQYLGAYRIGYHRGKYEALVQAKPVTVYRDRNRDGLIDGPGSAENIGLFGINIHTTSWINKILKVGKWSAGCQVLQYSSDFKNLMKIVHNGADRWGNSFTYTLLDEKQIIIA